MKLTGQILKESREKQGISLNEVHIALKINSKTIEAIENGDLGKLPSFSFLRGFVQSYARFLKLDVESILTTFNEEMGSNPQLEKKYETPVEEVPTEEKVETPIFSLEKWSWTMRFSLIGGILVLIGLTILVKKTIDKYEKESQINPTVLPKNVITIPEKKEKTLVEEPIKLPENKEETPKGNKVVETPPPPTQESTPKPDPHAEVQKENPIVAPKEVVNTKPEPLPLKKSEDKKPTSENPTTVKVQKKSPPLSTTFKGQELIIEALDKVNISYTIDDHKTESVNLEADKVFTLKAKNKISLSLNNGGVVSIIHNGKDLGVPGALGQSYKRSFP